MITETSPEQVQNKTETTGWIAYAESIPHVEVNETPAGTMVIRCTVCDVERDMDDCGSRLRFADSHEECTIGDAHCLDAAVTTL